ncbi:tail fiber protein [Escherichia coli]
MNDVTVVTSVTYPSPESLALVADVQYHEPYLSAALNRKFRGIVDPGFYAGFLPKPGGGMNLLITSVDGDKTAGAASVDIGEFYQVTIQHRKDISLALSAGKKYAIVLKGRYLLGEDTYQVNTASHIHAAEFVTRTYTDSYQLGDGELLVCTVNIPAGVSAITQEMIDTSERINRTIGIDISDSVTSTRSDVAASSLAVKKAYDLAKSKYTAQDASTTQKGLVQLSSETNSDSETMAATPKAVKSVKDLADTKAPIESPSLTGTPTAPTAAQGTNSTQIANTAFVKAAITALINGAPGTLDTLKEIAAAINNDPNFSTTINNALALKAPLASPALTGIPTAPTAAQGTNNTQIATTAYVRAAISALVGSSPEALDTLNELAAALGNDPNFATTMTNALAGKQPLDATLTALAALATGANKLPYFTGKDTVAQTDLTSVGRDILAKTSTLAVIQYLGLRELGTSGEKIPLLSTANTWSARQTFNGGITGALTGNADTATKLKTARNINGVRFDGSGDININTLISRGRVTALEANAQGTSGIQLYEAYNNGYPSPYGNVLHLKGATAAGEGELFIGWSGTSGAHAPVHIRSRRDTDSANWSEWAQVYTSKDSIPGVNAKGNQDTSGNADTATKLQTACNINGVSFDGSKNIELTAKDLNLERTVELAAGALQKNQNGADIPGKDTFTKNIGAAKAASGNISIGGDNSDWTTAQFIEWLESQGAFNHPYWMCKGSWSYASNKIITDTGCGDIQLAGAVVEVMGTKNAMTIRITTPTTAVSGTINAQFTYINHGDSYSPGWRRDWNRQGDSMTGTINQDGGSQNAYMSTALCSGTRGGKKYLRKFRGGEGDTIWHETVQGGVIRLATGNTDAQEELSFSQSYGLRSRGEITSLSANGLRIAYGNYGFFIRNDGGSTYLMLTASGDKFGSWNGLRPLTINNANGGVSMGHGLSVTGDIASSTKVRAGSGKKFTVSSSNTSTKEAAFNLWGSSSRPVVAELGDDAGWHFYSQRNTDNSITFAVNGQVSPSNYGNFDSRYVRDIRLGGASSYKPANNGTTWTHQAPSGCAYTGIIVQDTGSNSADNIGGVYYRPIQKNINGTWYNVSSV